MTKPTRPGGVVRKADAAVAKNYLTEPERSDLDVRLSTAQKLAECFGVTLSELMRGL